MGSSLREALLPSRAFRRQPPGVMGIWQLRSHSSRVGGVTKHVAERGPVGSVPADLSLVRPGADTVGELDVVIDEVAQQSAHRAAPLEDGEHQPDDLPDPLVRIEGNLAGRLEHVAARQPQHQFAALGFRPPSLMHPTLEDVQFGLAHRTLEAKQQAVVVGPRVVDAVGVPDERVEQRAHLRNWCQSRQERARRETSIPRTRPTWPRPTSATRRWKPGLSEVEAPERPRSSSMTTTWSRRQPSRQARSASPYWRRVDSRFCSTWRRVDWRT